MFDEVFKTKYTAKELDKKILNVQFGFDMGRYDGLMQEVYMSFLIARGTFNTSIKTLESTIRQHLANQRRTLEDVKFFDIFVSNQFQKSLMYPYLIKTMDKIGIKYEIDGNHL